MGLGSGPGFRAVEGDWNAVCFQCGRTFKASEMRKHWKGYWVCTKHWEAREAQDFVRGIPDLQAPPWVQPPATYGPYMCTPNGLSAVPDFAMPDCAVPDYLSPAFNIEGDPSNG
jgi:hypothetical protein